MSFLYDPPALLAHLIEHGFAPAPLTNMPPEWRAAFDAVRAVTGTRADRQAALERAIASSVHADGLRNQLAFVAKMAGRNYPRELRTAADVLPSQPVPDWRVEGLFTHPSLNMLVGAPGAKKTLLALDLAVCVALGKPWLTRPTVQSPVLYLDEETGLALLWPRLQAALRAHNAPPQTPLNFVALPGFDLRYHSDSQELQEMALNAKAGLIILDALADLSSVTENSAKSMQRIFANLRAVAQKTNATVLVIHHTNKSGTYRGSTAISAGVDLVLSVHSEPESPFVRINPQKGRSFLPLPIVAQAIFEGDQCSFTPSAIPRVGILRPGYQSILDFLGSNGPATGPQIVAAFPDRLPGTIRSFINDLVTMALLRRVDVRLIGNTALYDLTPKGREHVQRSPP